MANHAPMTPKMMAAVVRSPSNTGHCSAKGTVRPNHPPASTATAAKIQANTLNTITLSIHPPKKVGSMSGQFTQ